MLLGGVLAVLSVLLQPAPALPAPAAYCNGQTIVTDSAVRYYANGQRVADGFGKQYYSNGVRIVNDSGDDYETGVEMTPCPRSVSIRQRLGGDETIAYELDIAAGTINLRDVRCRFPSGGVITVLSANLVAGEINAEYFGELRVRHPGATVAYNPRQTR